MLNENILIIIWQNKIQIFRKIKIEKILYFKKSTDINQLINFKIKMETCFMPNIDNKIKPKLRNFNIIKIVNQYQKSQFKNRILLIKISTKKKLN